MKKITSLLFTTLFLMFLMAPTIITMVDDSIDVSFFYTTSEEEEKGFKKNAEKEFLCHDINTTALNFGANDIVYNSGYYLKKYLNPYLKLASPPPKPLTLKF